MTKISLGLKISFNVIENSTWGRECVNSFTVLLKAQSRQTCK